MWVGPLPGRTGLLCLCLSIVLATALEHEPQTEDEVPEPKYKVKEEDPEVSTTGGATTGQGWYLVGLRGNVSVVHQRLGDFLLYLRINLASIALTQYERVTVNSVSYKPTLLVNITFTGSYNTSRLEQLSQMEDSLFLLSYQPFHVTSFTAGTEILVARPVTNSLSTAREEEAIFYLGISGTIAFLLSAALMVCVLLLVNKRSRVRDKEPLIVPSSSASGSVLCQDAPHTIYSEHFSQQDLAREKERLHSFTALDDSLCPITNMDLDFTPRYLREDDRVSWISEGSLPVPVDIHSDPGGSNFFPSDGYRPVLSTFSEDGSITGPDTVDSRQSKSPFYWQSSTPTSSPVPRPSPLPPVLSRHPQKRNGKTPPRPPSRSDSLNPNSKTKIHSRPKSAAPMRTRASSGSPSSDFPYTSRPLSVPVPGHMSCYHSTPSSRHSSICAPSPTQCPSPRDIEKDVSHILSNLGIEETQ